LLDVTHLLIFPFKAANTFKESRVPEFCLNALSQETSFLERQLIWLAQTLIKLSLGDAGSQIEPRIRHQNEEIAAQRLLNGPWIKQVQRQKNDKDIVIWPSSGQLSEIAL
jgi:hypothetical protein